MGTIMQQTAVLKLGNYSFYNYRYVYFAAHAGTSVYMLDNSQSNILKNLYFHINKHYYDSNINDHMQLLK